MRPSTVVTGVVSGLAAVVALAAPATALGPAPAHGATGSVSPQAAGDRLPFLRWCTARVLRGVVEPPDAGAGQRYSRLVVTNTGPRSCVLFGYGRLRLQAADGSPLPTRVHPTGDPGPTVVVLAPGGRAAANLHWTVVPGPGEPVDQQCEPDPAWLWVWPTYRFRPFAVPWTFGPVCQHGLIDQSAYHPI